MCKQYDIKINKSEVFEHYVICNIEIIFHATLLECLAQSERQAAATEEITASMQELAASAAEIEKIARLI
ncbi:hypothetical protein [Paenibacillus ihuae]|uniref:hypothetical protein n=1 Tax=Paenibacillus ihuae TaxID=1232431 RepID=UPI0006D55C04|nr:hypothetical protein [Paenibacillus ihuae]